MQGEGEGAAVLLPVPLRIAEGKVNVDSLIDTGGGREGICDGAAVLVLNCAGGGAAVLVCKIPIIAEGRV